MIKESLILPSQGFPYNNRLEGSSVKLQPLTTRAYKDFIISNDEEGVLNLVDSCLVDCPLKAEEFVYADVLAMYLKIRSMTLGTNITLFSVCPHCKLRNKIEWDLMSMPCKYLSVDEYPIPITLPDSGKTIGLCLPTYKNNQVAKEEAQKRASRYNKPITDFLSSFNTVVNLQVSGVGDLVSKAEWYENLPLRDVIYIDQASLIIQDFGLITSKDTVCTGCKKEYRTPFNITQEFFRPSLGDISGFSTSQGTLQEGPSDSDSSK